MKHKYIILLLTLLISGTKHFENDIDVYVDYCGAEYASLMFLFIQFGLLF
jgi:hypothetical protein